MKKTIAILCVIFLLAGLVTGCEKGPDEAQLALQEEWLDVLRFQENLLALTDWAYDYAEGFVEDNTWESLLKAQAACAAALEGAEGLALPEKNVTAEQYSHLMEQGIEAEVVAQEFAMLDTFRRQTVDTLTRLLTLLRDDVYLTPSVDMLPQWLESNRETDRLTAAYYLVTTNYLGLQLDNTQVWEENTEPMPNLNQVSHSWNEDPEAITQQTEELLDALEAQVNLQNTFLGTAEYTLDLVRKATETGDISMLSPLMHDIQGREFYYPMPYWVTPDARWRFYVPGENAEQPQQVRFGDDLEEPVCQVEVLCPGITREDMDSYFESISYWGLEPVVQGENQWMLSVGDYRMTLILTESGAEIRLSGSIACLVPELYLMAILLK